MLKPTADLAFWNSNNDGLLLNPRLPDLEKRAYENAWVRERGRRAGLGIQHTGLLALATSGVSGILKLVLLPRQAIFASAVAVNAHLRSDQNDIWYQTLPDFHIGGLAMYARAAHSGARVVEHGPDSWSAEEFVGRLRDCRATLTSLVPTQIFDLVRAGQRSPQDLRAAIVGGGGLGADLYREARRLGWPVLPSYGLTECCSQVATAALDSLSSMPSELPSLKILPHIEARSVHGGRIELRSNALLDGYLWIVGETSRFDDPKRSGWFLTDDRGRLTPDYQLEVLGRGADFVKIGGESVDLAKLENHLEKLRLRNSGRLPDVALLAIPDERLGSIICLLCEDASSAVDHLVDSFNMDVAPFERIRQTHEVNRIPRSALGKLLRADALTLVRLQSSADVGR